MKNIKNIIFDLGGIFMELSYKKTEDAFISLGIANFHQLFTQHKASPLFVNLETGRLGEEEFYKAFRELVEMDLSNDRIKAAWNAMLLSFPLERLTWLAEISKKYKTFLFSNTNIIHYNAVQKIFRENTGNENFDDYFIEAYYSHQLGLRKPDDEAFLEILEREKLAAEETLFVDDTPVNIEAAKRVGMQAILLQSPKTVFDLNL
jgi:glucose-1-phosphatase